MPDGGRGWAITCKEVDDCYDLAGQACPHGYEMVDRGESEHGEARGGVSFGMPYYREQRGSRLTLLLQCKSGEE
jgi:hypothetical protein